MSGGSYDYAYLDAERMAETISDITRDAQADDDVPERVVTRLDDLHADLLLASKLMKALEWYKSGDYSAEKMEEEIRKTGWI